jgi:hypothetical protein
VSATVVLSAYDVLQYPEGGGHFSAFLQYVHGLEAQGCEVWWLEGLAASGDPAADARTGAELAARLDAAGLHGRALVYSGDRDEEREWLTVPGAEADAVLARAELLLNFAYELDADMLGRFRRTALVDIDPGLLQVWMAGGDLEVAPHDLYFTTGETVGTPAATFPSCGLDWIHIRPPVSLEHWPFIAEAPHEVFTTVSSWSSEEHLPDGEGGYYENSKRAAFVDYLEVAAAVPVPLELALSLGEDEREDAELLARHGWRVRPAREVTATPASYRAYVQGSAGEFSCAKPSCMRLQNAWISDRTVCYLASGRPAVVQNTGPSSYLEGGHGLKRFATPAEAAEALREVQRDYGAHRIAARELAAAHFDARAIAGEILDAALGAGDPAARRVAG